MKQPLALALASGVLAGGFYAGAQESEAHGPSIAELTVAEPGAPGTPRELEAWGYVRANKLIKAREVAEALVHDDPRSYVGHFVLGFVHHYAEANFPRALFHLNDALRLFEERHGAEPAPGQPWRWHARLLRELGAVHGDLEHYEERLSYITQYNILYDPDVIAEQAWALMKLGRYDDARTTARAAIEGDDEREVEVALNALCAIEFEAGNDGASYQACRAALEYARNTPGEPNAVDLTNFAEAARSAFRLDEAERVLLEATRAPPAWYGNPWLELGELYTRSGRFPEALDALGKVPPYRNQRPPHVRDADLNESRRALSAFYLVVGRPEEAMRITDKALVMPDRRAHNSRDPAQDRAVIALLDRMSRNVVAEMNVEAHTAAPWYERVWARLQSARLRWAGWMSGRQAARLLADDARMVGTFRIGTSSAAIVPPWLVGELVEVAGSGIVQESVRRARSRDERQGSDAYYDAFAAEAALGVGDEARALELAQRARAGIPDGDALLRARVDAIRAEATRRESGVTAALEAYETAMGRDPGVFRRMGLAVPVRITATGDAVAEEVRDALERSPRLDVGSEGLLVRIEATASSGRVCLNGSAGTVLDCGSATPEPADSPAKLAQRIVDAFHARVFAPRIDLSQSDISSLDGSNRVARDPMEGMVPQP